jgi:hypothetical protein
VTFSPGAREVDPLAEAARLADDRVLWKDRLGYTLLLEDIRQVQRAGADPVYAHIVVTVSESHPVPHDLGAKIADVIRENWPVREPGDG